MLLVENPQDALRLILNGISVSQINIGSLSFNSSKQMISDAVAVDKRDIETFKAIKSCHINIFIQKVSNETPKDLWEILKNKKMI